VSAPMTAAEKLFARAAGRPAAAAGDAAVLAADWTLFHDATGPMSSSWPGRTSPDSKST
jgi:homoaconitase/3-isopropylmalate dehydratase large subunit